MTPRQRHPDNNPTERIQRVLTEFSEWIAHVEWIEDWLAKHYSEALQYLPQRPGKEHFAVESKHQQDHGQRNKRARKYMSLMRSASDEPALGSMRQMKERAIAQKPGIPAWQRAIVKQLEFEDAHPETLQPTAPTDIASLVDVAAANDARIGLPPGVEIEADPETAMLEQDLKEGKLF